MSFKSYCTWYDLVESQRAQFSALVRNFQSLVMSERDSPTVQSIALFETIVIIAALVAPCVVNTERRCSDFEAFWQKANRILSTALIEEVKYVASNTTDKT